MTVRRANFADIPAIVGLIVAAYERSSYVGRDEPDMPHVKRLLTTCVQRHGAPGEGGTFVAVAEGIAAAGRGGLLDGVIVGILDRVYGIGHKLSALDLFFVVDPGADPRAAGGMVDAFNLWAAGNTRVIEAKVGAVDLAGTDHERTGRLYQRKGFRRVGAIYLRSFER